MFPKGHWALSVAVAGAVEEGDGVRRLGDPDVGQRVGVQPEGGRRLHRGAGRASRLEGGCGDQKIEMFGDPARRSNDGSVDDAKKATVC